MYNLSGLTIAVTGTLNNFTRDEAASFINRNGGKFTTAVGKNTNYLVVGDKPGYRFYHADLTNTTKISEEDLIQMANYGRAVFQPRPTSVREKLKANKLSDNNIDSMVKALIQALDYDLWKEMYLSFHAAKYAADKTTLRNIVKKYL